MIFSEDATKPVPRDAAGVVVVGETPYAEGFGDVGGPLWAYDPGDNGVPRPPKTMQLSDADEQAVRKVCARAATCTVLVVSGRPMVIPPELRSQIDALVASWLPGSEGRGVADVLFGRAAVHRQAPGQLAALGGPGADQHRRPELQPVVRLRIWTADLRFAGARCGKQTRGHPTERHNR